MKTIAILLFGVMALVAPSASAQNSNSAPEGPTGPKPAIKIDRDTPGEMPITGKTSFTADQAKARMEKRGYNITSNPIKDDRGIWYAEARKASGRLVQIMVDYQGNVFETGEYSGHPSSAPGVEPVAKSPIAKAPQPNSNTQAR